MSRFTWVPRSGIYHNEAGHTETGRLTGCNQWLGIGRPSSSEPPKDRELCRRCDAYETAEAAYYAVLRGGTVSIEVRPKDDGDIERGMEQTRQDARARSRL